MKTLGNKPPWTRLNTHGPLPAPELSKLVNRAFATQFIAERLEKPHETIRALRDKIGKQLDRALKNQEIKASNGRFQFGDLTAWAHTKSGLTKAFEGLHGFNSASAHLTSPSIQLTAFGHSTPNHLDDCRAALKAAYLELNQLREENRLQRATIAELTPFKEKAVWRSEAAKTAGARGGRPKKQ
jgi:hypothetical protein